MTINGNLNTLMYMENPKVEYNVFQVEEHYKNKTEKIKAYLKNKVESGNLDPIEARKELDMHLSMLLFMNTCARMAESESFIGDYTFSQHVLYSAKEGRSNGKQTIKRALKKLK